MTSHETLIKIEELKLRDWDQEDNLLLNEYTQVVSDYEAFLVLSENPLVQKKLEKMQEEIRTIDFKLATDRTLPQTERDYLFAKKEIYKDLITELTTDKYGDEVKDIQKNIQRFK